MQSSPVDYCLLTTELTRPEFYEFRPADGETLHDIRKLTRPVVVSFFLNNNLQVTVLIFAPGMTGGLETGLLLIYNGVHLGAVSGWMQFNGSGRELWGWVMSQGVTGITAVIIAGTAGFLQAKGLLMTGRFRRTAALKIIAKKTLVLKFGCMVMLVVAGLIEGFVSPGRIGYTPRILIMTASILVWLAYFFGAGRKR